MYAYNVWGCLYIRLSDTGLPVGNNSGERDAIRQNARIASCNQPKRVKCTVIRNVRDYYGRDTVSSLNDTI